MKLSQLVVFSTVIYEHSELDIDVVENFKNISSAQTNTSILSIIVALCILFIFYAFLYVTFWYIDRHMNNSNMRLFRIITFGKRDAKDVDAVSAILYAGLVAFIVILILTDLLGLIIAKILSLMIGG